VTEFIGKQAAAWFGAKLVWLFQAAGSAMPEITTVSVVACALVLMLTGDASKWLGRAGLAVLVGIVWRLLV
jgi:hypothetical protein